jgi:hypothetical protein
MNDTPDLSRIARASKPASKGNQVPSWKYLFLAVPFLVGGLLMIHAFVGDLVTAKRQQTTVGTIRAHEPSNHNRYGYQFTVDGRSLSGWATPPDSQRYVIGGQVTVYYDPFNPRRSALEPFEALAQELVGSMAFAFAGSAVIVVMFLVGRFLGWRGRPSV